MTIPIPNEGQFIDFHTHTKWNYPNIFSIRSLVKPGEAGTYMLHDYPVSIGVHPWFINEARLADEVLQLKEAAAQAHIVMIGECGIDLKCNTPYPLQEKAFIQQAEIAQQLKKPLVVHCVKAYQSLTNYMKQLRPTIPWIFHGFNHNEFVAGELAELGAYFSVGADLFRENSKIRRTITRLPLDRLFFETDEWQQPVWKIYKEAAAILGLPEKTLIGQIHTNYLHCMKTPVEEI